MNLLQRGDLIITTQKAKHPRLKGEVVAVLRPGMYHVNLADIGLVILSKSQLRKLKV